MATKCILYEERMDAIFSKHGNWRHRTLRTIFDPLSHDYSKTTLKEKLEILRRIPDAGENLDTLILHYKLTYIKKGRSDIAGAVEEALAGQLDYSIKNKKEEIILMPSKFNSIEATDSLFAPPLQWGTRVNPYLWMDIQAHYILHFDPETMDFSQFRKDTFKKCVGKRATKEAEYAVPRYAHGGMSSGDISCDFWLETGFPLLIGRYEVLGLKK